MATVTKALFRGAATTTLTTTLYTVPSATTTVVSNIVVVNTAATATITSAAHLTRITVGTTFVLVQVGYVTAFTVSGTTVTVGSQTIRNAGAAFYAVAYTVSSTSGLLLLEQTVRLYKHTRFRFPELHSRLAQLLPRHPQRLA